jgi:hypothetical protein
LDAKPAAQDAGSLKPADRHLDVIGAQIIELARQQIVAHRRLRFRQPAAVAERLDKLLAD